MDLSWRKFFSILPLLLGAILVIVGFLWYTGRLVLHFETFSTYSNSLLGVSFRYPSTWKPDATYGMVGNESGRYAGKNGFFGVDAIGTTDDIMQVTDGIAHHKLKPYGASPIILPMKAGDQEARAILPSKDQPLADREVALIVQYPTPVRIQDKSYQYLMIVGDPSHIKTFADTLQFF